MDAAARRRHRREPPPPRRCADKSVALYRRDLRPHGRGGRPRRRRHRHRPADPVRHLARHRAPDPGRRHAGPAGGGVDAVRRAAGAALRGVRPPADRAAICPAPDPRGHVVTPARREQAWAVAAAVCDPEIPVLTIADLGVLRDVREDGETLEVVITPTYSGCPAMNMIALEIETALDAAGLRPSRVVTVLSPAWTTDWLTAEGRRKLSEYGIAPPAIGAGTGTGTGGRRALFAVDAVTCPRCGSTRTTRLAEFGSTSCKALWRCEACREPFDYFKCH
ncbi:MAG: phenylacetate-CoA oxygenase subunit PaaJ [Rhodospirillales bacterium]|nr:phenylacetate-CoA oxygenase subunit PaaJ [Rhodospirillales bacterium]